MNRRFLSVLLALSLTACTAGFGSEPTVAEDVVAPGTPSAAERTLAEAPLPDYTALYTADYHGGTRTGATTARSWRIRPTPTAARPAKG